MSTERHSPASRRYLFTLSLAALGVVYGDIGTSPLYSLKECLSPHYGIAAQRENVLGLLSLMAWSETTSSTRLRRSVLPPKPRQ